MAEFQETGGDGSRLVSMAGEIDLAVTDEVIAVVRSSLSGADHVDLDFAGVTFIDSSGLGALVLLRNEAAGQGKQLSLVNLSPATSRLLRITGLQSAFDICADHA
jgi:anti-anti-sigma factor